MRILTLISRTLTVTSPPSPVRLSFLLFHSSPCEESSHRRRPEPLPRRNYEEENRAVKVTVWWDFENCSVPVGINVERVAGRITAALRSTGIKGPVTITAFGDVVQMSRATQEALTSTGVCLNHVPHRGKNSSDRSFMADLVYWVTQNPPPAHFFLISGDKDFANILHRLRMSNYNILLSSNDCATPVLCSAATVMWPWVGLVKGENVNAKHFNHPPDGLYGSWYGHYKGVLDDPFVIGEQYSVPKAEESVESVSETKNHPVPKSIVNAIRNVLHSYPEGMYISELRAELKRKGAPVDREFYGYKKFSNLLSSLPTIVKFIPNPAGQGQPLVTDKRASELSYKCDEELETSNLDKVPTSISDGKSLTRDTKQSQITPLTAIIDTAPSHEVTNVDTSADLPKSQVHNAVVDGALLGRKETTSEPPIPEQGHDAEVKGGLFQRIWSSLTGTRGDYPLVKSDSDSVVNSTATEDAVDSDNLKRLKSEKKDTELRSSVDPASSSTSDLSAKKSDPEEKKSEQCDKHSGMPKTRTGFFSQLKNWWQSWKYGAKDQEDRYEDVNQEVGANGKCVKNFPQNNCHPENHELFSQSHFWDALESFLLTSKGSELISTSTTRDQLLGGLQKEGPCIVKDLTEGHFLRLVDLLISEKRWLEENASESFPFKLALPNKRTCAISKAHGSNGLSSLFRASTSHSNLQRLPEQGKQDQYACSVSREANPPQNLMELKAWFQRTCIGKRNIQPEEFQKLFESKFNKKLICSSYGYPSVQTLLFACSAGNNIDQGKKKPPRREEVLSDCHKLLKDLLKEHPQGINMSNFRPAFFHRYGYVLDCPMLGYPKLASLLQIMPGVKVESSFIMPVEMFNSEAFTDKTVDIGGKVMSLDSDGSGSGEEWEELGPVSDTVPSNNNNKGHKVVEQVTSAKVSLSDEELTDSEDDIPYSSDKSSDTLKRGGENSSLLQLLDSWYSGKEGRDGKEQDEAADGLIDCSAGNSQNSSDPAPVDSSKSKIRPHKSYNFVVDSGQDENDKFVDSILGTLKKSGDSRLQSS